MIQFGECIVDWKQRIIILDTNYQYTEVVLEGMETPEMNDDYEIPLVFEEAMIAWLALQDILYLPATSHMNNKCRNQLNQVNPLIRGNFHNFSRISKTSYPTLANCNSLR